MQAFKSKNFIILHCKNIGRCISHENWTLKISANSIIIFSKMQHFQYSGIKGDAIFKQSSSETTVEIHSEDSCSEFSLSKDADERIQ